MRTSSIVIALIATFLVAPASNASAQTRHIADSTVVSRAVEAQQQTDAADRAVILKVLTSDAATRVAASLGLSLTTAESAVSMLTGTELAQRAASARAIDAPLSGGSNTIVISTTTLLLILIIVILVVR